MKIKGDNNMQETINIEKEGVDLGGRRIIKKKKSNYICGLLTTITQ